MKAFDDKECNRIKGLAEKLREGFNQAFSQARILGNARDRITNQYSLC
ncbi:MAG: hypothetical protein Ct9H300mP3_11240 [Gammaproteobacteria bacterium]|nr:MAG: hypothetical protein Ct9H300mP3_11240 [Gammaproteobacteria bacterium]